MKCKVEDCPKHHCYYCGEHLPVGHISWFCSEEEKDLYWKKEKELSLSIK